MYKPFCARHLVTCLIITLIAALPRVTNGKEYSIPAIRIEAEVQPDGTIRITEHRTYQFEGEFSYVYYRLPLKGYQRISDIRVAEDGRDFINRNSEESGTFMVSRDDDTIETRWFFSAEDESRTYTVSYTLEGALTTGPEWSQFFWYFLSGERDKDTGDLQVTFRLPQAVSADSLQSWVRGPDQKINITQTNSGFRLTATHIDDDRSIRVRSVFPRRIFDGTLSTTDADFSLAFARQDEQEYRKRQQVLAERNARYAGYGQKLAVVVVLLSILAFIYLYRTYGKRPRVDTPPESLIIPGRLRPAVAGWLAHGRTVSSSLLMATLLDLARRRYYTIDEKDPEEQWLGEDKRVFTLNKSERSTRDELTGWEQELLTFADEQIEQGNNRIDELFSGSSYSAAQWFSEWKEQLHTYCNQKQWYDPKSHKGVYLNIGIQLFLLLAGVGSIILAGPVGIVPTIVPLALVAGSAAIIRRTPEGERTYRKWKAYRDGLKNAGEHSVSDDSLDKHYIYAVAFGLSEQDIKTVFNRYDGSEMVLYWIVFHPGQNTSPASVASAMTTLSATGTSAFPGASAAGSGAAGASATSAGGGATGGAG